MYVAQLRQLTQYYCEFGDSLEEMLRDRLVCGIADVRMQRALLAEPQLTFTKALQMIQIMETAHRDSRELQAQITGPVPVNTVARTQATATKPCFCCGEQHSPATCRFTDFVCNFCKKTGYIMRACRSKQRAGNNQQLRRSEGDTHHITATEQEDSYSLFNTKGLGHQPFYMTLTVQGEQLQMELDTGAAVSVMSEQTYKTVWNAEKAPPIEPAQVQLHVYTGDTIPVLGWPRLQ